MRFITANGREGSMTPSDAFGEPFYIVIWDEPSWPIPEDESMELLKRRHAQP